MKNYIFYFTVFVLLIFCFQPNFVFSQNKKPKITKVTGEIVGYNKLASLTNSSFAPKVQTFIVKVTNFKDNESEYLNVVYEYFEDDKGFLKLIFSNQDATFKFSLIRNCKCDNTFEEVRFGKGIKEDGTEVKVNLMEDLGGLSAISSKTILPCYFMKNVKNKK